MREVEAKRKRWREIAAKEGGKFLGKHMIPTVLGPKARHYVVDHHHLARALHDEGVKDVAVTLIANLSKLEQDEFWTVMDNRSWMHPFDSKGQRRHYDDDQFARAERVQAEFLLIELLDVMERPQGGVGGHVLGRRLADLDLVVGGARVDGRGGLVRAAERAVVHCRQVGVVGVAVRRGVNGRCDTHREHRGCKRSKGSSSNPHCRLTSMSALSCLCHHRRMDLRLHARGIGAGSERGG